MAPCRGRSRQGASEEAATGQGLLARGAHGRAPPPAQCPGQPQGEAPVRRYRPSTKEETEGQRGSRGGPRTHGWGAAEPGSAPRPPDPGLHTDPPGHTRGNARAQPSRLSAPRDRPPPSHLHHLESAGQGA